MTELAEIDMNEEAVQRFFAYARERHLIYLRRAAGLPAPWTTEPVMSRYRITNVFRELDKTTVWFRVNVRDRLYDRPEVLLATVLFRWFNTIRSGETVFLQPGLFGEAAAEPAGVGGDRGTPWGEYLATADPEALRGPLRRQGAPWVTGAYMIRSPEGMDKLDGIVHSVDWFRRGSSKFEFRDGVVSDATWTEVANECLDRRDSDQPVSLRAVWEWLKGFYGMGPFLAYEVVTDLRWTKLLNRAPDIMTWANPGPGALRGANLILRGANRGRKGRLEKASVAETHEVMRALLELSRSGSYWPQEEMDPSGYYTLEPKIDLFDGVGLVDERWLTGDGEWPEWDMREPEMFLCEYAKLERTRLGFGRPRGSFP